MSSYHLARPTPADGAELWRLAGAAGGLDVNSAYAYVLLARDFAATCCIARSASSEPAGFVVGYLRPRAPDTLFIWQVVTSPEHRGHGLAGRMLDDVVAACGATRMEATVTPGNDASKALFAGFAARRDAPITSSPLFPATHFPDSHDPEDLLSIGPFENVVTSGSSG